jgi:carbon monoxide dehydrogenase subunit G
MDVIATHTIKAPCEKVHAYLADPTNDPEWRKNTSSAALISGVRGAVGARYEQVITAMGNPATVLVTLTSADDARLTFLGEGGPMPVDVTFDTVAEGDDTVVTLTIAIDIPPALERMASRMIALENQKDLAKLAEMLEH